MASATALLVGLRYIAGRTNTALCEHEDALRAALARIDRLEQAASAMRKEHAALVRKAAP